MSHAETGAILVPNLADRLHPGVAIVREALQRGRLGAFRSLRYEVTADSAAGDLARHYAAIGVDVVRALLGEIEEVTATGDPPGESPDQSLIVQLRAAQSRRAEIRFDVGPARASRLVLSGEDGSLALEIAAGSDPRPSVIERSRSGENTLMELEPWNPFEAILEVFDDSIAGQACHPDLIDGTRAMEVSEGVVRSLRRGRTVELHYEEISEAGTFKSVMTSVGCLLLLAILVVVPLALAGPPLGLAWTIYFAYVIPPMLVMYVLLQMLRFALRDPRKQLEKKEKHLVHTEFDD
jgi:myo-inositol 2-dehydrogenase/D-chiro-inositol 1-dehydrogenase